MVAGHLLMNRSTTFCLVLVLALSAGVAGARVFMRGRAGDVVGQLRQAMQAKTAYQSRVNVNGSDGDMTVLSLPSDLTTVARLLRRLYPGGAWEHNGRIGQGHVVNGATTTRLIGLDLEQHGSSIVFALTQSTRAFEAARRGPVNHLMRDVAPFPGSRPQLYVRDDGTGFSLAISKSSAPAADIRRSFARRLEADDWRAAVPTSAAASNGTQIYRRELDLCVVLVSADMGAADHTITVLHKRPGRE